MRKSLSHPTLPAACSLPVNQPSFCLPACQPGRQACMLADRPAFLATHDKLLGSLRRCTTAASCRVIKLHTPTVDISEVASSRNGRFPLAQETPTPTHCHDSSREPHHHLNSPIFPRTPSAQTPSFSRHEEPVRVKAGKLGIDSSA